MIIVGIITISISLILIYRPWSYYSYMQFLYIKSNAVKVAESIEEKQSISFNVQTRVNKVKVRISIFLPNETPLIIRQGYSVLYFKVPTSSYSLIRGSNRTFYGLPRVCVYQRNNEIIVDPKPILNYTRQLEYYRELHLVTIELFYIPYSTIEKGETITYSNSTVYIFERTYSYSGTSLIAINGRAVFRFKVKKGDIIRLVIIIDKWS